MDHDWLPAWEARKLVAEAYRLADMYQPEMCAEAAILRRLAFGTAQARPFGFAFDFTQDGDPPETATFDLWTGGWVPPDFWQIFQISNGSKVVDWLAGDFSFSHADAETGTRWSGVAHGIALNRSGLPLAGLPQAEVVTAQTDHGLADLVKRRRGRPEGSGGFAAQDAPLVAKMHEMILATPGKTPFGAAAYFVGEAEGTGEFEAKQRRLAKLYRKTYPDRSALQDQ